MTSPYKNSKSPNGIKSEKSPNLLTERMQISFMNANLGD